MYLRQVFGWKIGGNLDGRVVNCFGRMVGRCLGRNVSRCLGIGR